MVQNKRMRLFKNSLRTLSDLKMHDIMLLFIIIRPYWTYIVNIEYDISRRQLKENYVHMNLNQKKTRVNVREKGRKKNDNRKMESKRTKKHAK
jgi:hypothetical protein